MKREEVRKVQARRKKKVGMAVIEWLVVGLVGVGLVIAMGAAVKKWIDKNAEPKLDEMTQFTGDSE